MHKDYINGFVTVAIGAFVLIYAQSFSRGGFSVAENAAVYPQLLAGVLVFLGVLLLTQTWLAHKQAQRAKVAAPAQAAVGGHGRVALIAGALTGFVVVTWLAGFVPANLLFCFLAPLILGTSKKTALIVSLALTAFIYLLFFMFFQVPIPYGILFD